MYHPSKTTGERTMNMYNEREADGALIQHEKPHSVNCAACGKQFSNEKQYFGHLRVHSRQVFRYCDRCTRARVSFNSRMRRETDETIFRSPARPFECALCDKTFERPSQLDYHRRSVHMDEKSQICQICGKGFFRKNDLQTHLNAHLGTNQSICEICGRKFNHVSNLIRHCRTHTGFKPYPCTVCGKRFTQISSLAKHKRVHSSKIEDASKDKKNESATPESDESKPERRKIPYRRHYCRICGESFSYLDLLRRHKKLHADARGSLNEKLSSRPSDCTHVQAQRRANVGDNVANCSDEYSANAIGLQLADLAQRINPDELEADNEVSISDIFSSYDCNEIETSCGDKFENTLYKNLQNKQTMEKSYDIVQSLNNMNFSVTGVEFSDSEAVKTRASRVDSKPGKTNESTCFEKVDQSEPSFHFEGDQFYIENCESANPKCTNADARIEEIQKILELRHTAIHSSDEGMRAERVYSRMEEVSSKSNGTSGVPEIEVDGKDRMLRLVKTTTGEEFYELIVNGRCSVFDHNKNNEKDSEEYVSQFCENAGIARLLNSDDRRTSSTQDWDKIVHESTNEILQCLPNVENRHDAQCPMSKDNSQMPMVRLVQNEDGEQFFELVREPLEYEKNKFIEENLASSSDFCANGKSSKVTDDANRQQASISNGDLKRSKDISTENKQKPAKSKTRKFHCDECDKWFSTAYNFKQHAGTHFFDQQKYRCEVCDLSFAWKSTLNKHLAGNHRRDGPQKFVCKICPKVYSTLSQVNEHVKRDHLKERNHVCTLCDKSFFKKFDLKTHRRTHTNERPYICRACGKGFHHQSHIIRHERIHSGERPYECNVCQKKFAQSSSLKTHRQRHRVVKIDILEYRMEDDDPLTPVDQYCNKSDKTLFTS